MSLISDLKQSAPNLSKASKFLTITGIFYMLSGLNVLVWPGVSQTLYKDPPFAGQEQALFRLVGLLLLIVGWLYFFGGRTGGRQFVAAAILDRLILVPLVLVPLIISGVFPHTLSIFAILDPALALITWYLHSKSNV